MLKIYHQMSKREYYGCFRPVDRTATAAITTYDTSDITCNIRLADRVFKSCFNHFFLTCFIF